MSFSGTCHCGAVTFSVDGDAPTTAISCNCSHCRRKGLLLSFVAAEQFTIESGDDALTSYRFNKLAIEHRFCTNCGCQPFATGTGPDGSKMAAVNLRCMPALDIDALELQRIDGASF